MNLSMITSPFNNINIVHARYLRRIYMGLGALFLAVVLGTLSFMYIEGYGLIDAFYMTVITISTVGFKEVKDLSKVGRIFTAFFIIINIGIFAYVVSTITSFILDGEFRHFFKDYNIMKQINELKGHIIICGYGRLGKQSAHELKERGKELLIIENERSVVNYLRKRGDLLFVEGDATKDEVLEEAKVSEAQALISTLPHDADNVFVALTAREKNGDMVIISRANNKTSEEKLRRAGSDYVIMPENIGGVHMASLVIEPDLIEFMRLLTGQEGVSISFEEFSYENLPDKYKNKTIKDLDIRHQTGANIIGLKTAEGEYIINPDPTTLLKPKNKFIVLGTAEQRQNFKSILFNG